MSFANPKMFWLLATIVPLLAIFFVWTWIRRQALIRQFIPAHRIPSLTVNNSADVQKLRLGMFLIAVTLLILAMARPQSGSYLEEATQEGLDIILAVDTSRSMLAEDQSPNRMARAKLATLDLMHLATHDRLGLVAFAGSAFLQCPLTSDNEAFRQSVNALEIGVVPEGGTDITKAIQAAARAFPSERDTGRVLILLTDGEDHEEDALRAAHAAIAQGIRIFTLGVGTPRGELLKEIDAEGKFSFVKDDEGLVVKSRLDEELLNRIAAIGRGFYLPLRDPDAVARLHREGLEPLPKALLSNRIVERSHELYQGFISLAMALLLLDVFLTAQPLNKMLTALRVRPGSNALLTLPILLLVGSCLRTTHAASPDSALKNYHNGRFTEAQTEFEDLTQRHPDDPRLLFNAGTAAYAAGDYGAAVSHFAPLLRNPDLEMQQRGYYNLASSLYRIGAATQEPATRQALWSRALQHYGSALKLNPADTDAAFNHRFLTGKLEALNRQNPTASPADKSSKPPGDADQKPAREKRDADSGNKPQEPSESKPSERSQPAPRPGEKPDHNTQEPKPPRKTTPQPGDGLPGAASDNPNPGNSSESSGTPTATAGDQNLSPDPMTLEQAMRLLDSQKEDQKTIRLLPRGNTKSKHRKDW